MPFSLILSGKSLLKKRFSILFHLGIEHNQSILKEISPEYSLEGLMLKLKLQNFGHLTRTDSLEKTLMLGKIEGGRRRGQQRMRWLDGITSWMDVSLSSHYGSKFHAAVHGITEPDTTED